LLIAFPNADDPPSGNHESLESKIPKRKKARLDTRLSCKIEYFIETTSAYLSSRSAFFTDDSLGRCWHLDETAPQGATKRSSLIEVTRWRRSPCLSKGPDH